MNNPITMFLDEDGSGDWSMTRVVAFMFACVACVCLFVLSLLGVGIGWPFAFVVLAILFAVPFKNLFSSPSGVGLLGKLIDRFGIGTPAANAAPEAVASVLDRLRGVDDSRKDDERG